MEFYVRSNWNITIYLLQLLLTRYIMMMKKLFELVSLTVTVNFVQDAASEIVPIYEDDHHNNLFQSVGTNGQEQDQTDSDEVIAQFYHFLNSRIETKGRENSESELTNWENFQNQRYDESAAVFNASFQQNREYFNLKYLIGIEEGKSVPIKVGTISSYVDETLRNLPGIGFTPFNAFWKWLFRDDVKKLYAVLRNKMKNGEVVYTNKNRDGGLLYTAIESNPWWHRAMAYCAYTEKEKIYGGFGKGPKGFMCSVIFDMGLTILRKLVFFRDLTICAGLTFLTGDTNLCLALYIAKLVFPDWTGFSRETPYLAHNVNLY